MRTVAELTRRLIQSGLCPPDKLAGCTDPDLAALAARVGRPLPAEYKAMMGAIGRGAGDFLSDVAVYYPAVLANTEKVRKVVEGHGGQLPQTAFVFADRDGEQCLFFQLDGDAPDPPVYRWSDDRPKKFRKVFDSVWEFIAEELSSQEEMLRDDLTEEEEG